jgi:hypothetical protein
MRPICADCGVIPACGDIDSCAHAPCQSKTPISHWTAGRFCDGCFGGGAGGMSQGLRVLVLESNRSLTQGQMWPRDDARQGLELRRLINRQIKRLRTLENPPDMDAGAAIGIWPGRSRRRGASVRMDRERHFGPLSDPAE